MWKVRILNHMSTLKHHFNWSPPVFCLQDRLSFIGPEEFIQSFAMKDPLENHKVQLSLSENIFKAASFIAPKRIVSSFNLLLKIHFLPTRVLAYCVFMCILFWFALIFQQITTFEMIKSVLPLVSTWQWAFPQIFYWTLIQRQQRAAYCSPI